MELQRASNTQIKYLLGLKLKKNRLKYGRFVAEGDKVVKDIIRDNHLVIRNLYLMDSWLAEWNKLEIRSRFPVTIISAEAMQKVSSLKTSSAVLIECDIPSPVLVDGAKRVVFLDRINNPGNLGTILRCCDWFGVEQLILSPESADLYNPKTVQACMGSLGRIPIYYATAGQMATLRPALRNFYAVLDAAPVQSLVDLKEWMLCIGSESHGLSQETLSLPGTKVSIPKMTNSSIDSLNAAVAAGILISQFVEIS